MTSAPLSMAWYSPLTSAVSVPVLSASSTLTGITVTPAATPAIRPWLLMRLVMWVPCWWSSLGWASSLMKSQGSTKAV